MTNQIGTQSAGERRCSRGSDVRAESVVRGGLAVFFAWFNCRRKNWKDVADYNKSVLVYKGRREPFLAGRALQQQTTSESQQSNYTGKTVRHRTPQSFQQHHAEKQRGARLYSLSRSIYLSRVISLHSLTYKQALSHSHAPRRRRILSQNCLIVSLCQFATEMRKRKHRLSGLELVQSWLRQ